LRTTIDCCYKCTRPNKNPYCHVDCPVCTEKKAEHDRQKAEADVKKAVTSNLTAQVLAGVNKANKSRRRK
jgi:hypothetical protein